MALRHCLLGATDADLAKLFDITESTINLWKLKHPKFSESIKAGKEDADGIVANSLYSRATGHKQKAEKIFQNDGEVIRAEYVEYWPPEVTAQIFWLKNRQPERWRNGDRLELGGIPGQPLQVEDITSGMTVPEMKARLAAIKAKGTV